jgi:hypothetical protein
MTARPVGKKVVFFFHFFSRVGSQNLQGLQKKQILAQQPFLVRASPFGISRQICFFYEVGLSVKCPQPLLHEEKTLAWDSNPGPLGFKSAMLPTEPLRSSEDLRITTTTKANKFRKIYLELIKNANKLKQHKFTN